MIYLSSMIPKYKTRVSLTLHNTTLKVLREIAKASGVNISLVVERMFFYFINNEFEKKSQQQDKSSESKDVGC